MALTIFYSWQSDLPNPINRTFIENAIKAAIKKVGKELDLSPAERDEKLKLEKDTSGVPGSPPIVDTIFKKIDECAIFIPDMTFVGKTEKGRPIPNPNVSVEYGWALKSITYLRIVPVMNAFYGEPSWETLPFDMRHLRHPFAYNLKPKSTAEEKKEAKEALVEHLAEAIKTVIESGVLEEEGVQPVPLLLSHLPTPATDQPSIFYDQNVPLGIDARDFGDGETQYFVPGWPKFFIRIYPEWLQGDDLSTRETMEIAEKAQLDSVRRRWDSSGRTWVRNKYGVAAITAVHDEGRVLTFTQLFKNRELWGIDARMLTRKNTAERSGEDFAYFPSDAIEETLEDTLDQYLKIAEEHLELRPPLHLIVGVTDIDGHRMAVKHGFAGRSVEQNIIYEGEIPDYNANVHELLLPFFELLWEECGLIRHPNLRESRFMEST